MDKQLALIEVERSWKLDDETREIGRRGIAEARAALRRTAPATDHGARAA